MINSNATLNEINAKINHSTNVNLSIINYNDNNIIISNKLTLFDNNNNNNNFNSSEPNQYYSIINNIENLNQFKLLIKRLYEWANTSLANLVFVDCKLLSVLNTAKKLFFMECGDFYSYFLDLSDEYLNQERGKVEYEKIENLFFTAQNFTSLKNLDHKELFNFGFSNMILKNEKKYLDSYSKISQQNDLFTIMSELNNLNKLKILDNTDDVKILESITIEMNVEDKFLLNIIFSQKNLLKYKLLFRQLVLLKHQEKKLGEAWIIQKNFSQSKLTSYLKPSYLLRDKMINFVKNISHYLFHEVIENNFLNFVNQLKKGNSFHHILTEHEKFLDKCLKESFLNDFDLMINMSGIVQACLFYSGIIIKFYNTALQDENLLREQELRKKESKIKENAFQRQKKRIEEENELISSLFIGAKLGETIDGLGKKFEEGLELFLEKLSKLSSKSEEHLGKLLIRLDYNNYYFEKFSKKKFFSNN